MKTQAIWVTVVATMFAFNSCGRKDDAAKSALRVVPEITDDFALIPAGSFQMGDALDMDTSTPVHEVAVSAFQIAKYEVTKALWDEARTWGMHHGYPDLPVGEGKAATHPVQNITWYAMVKWCNARSEQEGRVPCYYTDAAQAAVYRTGDTDIANTMVQWSANGYRLPTEAEWEKAARGGLEGKRFPWGDTINHSQATFESIGEEPYQTAETGYRSPYRTGGLPHTSPAGCCPPNGYGLYDMAGNVWEWCWDWHGKYASGSQTDPRGPASGLSRIFRGGGWFRGARDCRVAGRNERGSSFPGQGVGFRLARGSAQPALAAQPAAITQPDPGVPGNPPAAGNPKSTEASKFVLIPAGEFAMGDGLDGSDNSPAHPANAPVHQVTVSAFYMQTKEVSWAEWTWVRTWAVPHGYADLSKGDGKRGGDPVQSVTWYDVVKWCNAKSEMEGLAPCYYTDAEKTAVYRTGYKDLFNAMVNWDAAGYRLPTEAEWEKAARGGLDGKRFPWGDLITHREANYRSDQSSFKYDVSPTHDHHFKFNYGEVPYTSPVGSFAANGYGLHDMAGNVKEWCWDWYDDDYYTTSPAADPRGPFADRTSGAPPPDERGRVIRGGDWYENANWCRVAERGSNCVPSWEFYETGFRLASSSAH
jgi:formylglycine-generating enzyme required for sulfatase activity